ncbi:MAG: tRNA (adenosine(37)-N6)-threonylcarbamoyltransferase complex ATPase subunit type 1 TsaE [candidate division KSB1 bacterium]|nr:tRNA (adenosine(37)-N6)-threonylcarbamoyltransferase complex ATPase subunit type 1 TsaE [candidate division KSB1 bacterium]MDZ7368641.1 tRNA (adenosine(37)-N6)-threonylcarbamoyltransferase complex ATPase subunit type 1 TsaE [candidate division KSB1 bacterium]MDZ7406323.1 tRNA (adenosine(37)-N6)-threonylcarbamoyltransferase complex ATPase subunit type 1 TsaE [candidate division KSB1 bacterium]
MLSTTELRSVLAGEAVFTIPSHSVEETHLLSAQLADQVQRGEVIALFGDLGSGKTTFVQGFCAASGVKAAVTSPTFTLMHIYRGAPWPIYHFDFYRLHSVAEAQALGCEEYFDGDGISLIEWPERALPLLPARHLQIHLRIPDFAASPDWREIKIHRAEAVA